MSVSDDAVLSELTGLGHGAGGLQRLTIFYEQGGQPSPGSAEALFNPTEISLARAAKWEQKQAAGLGGQASVSVQQEFRSVEPQTFSIELFFDTYASAAAGVTGASVASTVLPATLLSGLQGSDVRRYTGQIAALMNVDTELHRPPVCNLRWGAFDIFTGVLVRLEQRFTLFLPDGTPARALLTCEFAEAPTAGAARAAELHSADVIRTRQLHPPDTLHSVAAQEYGDPALWRLIATANGITSPRDLPPGTVVTIPKRRP